MLRGDATARVAHLEEHDVVAPARRERHRAARRCVVHGIRDQVAQHLANTMRIGVHPGQIRRNVDDQLNARITRAWPQCQRRRREQRLRVHRLTMQGQSTTLGQREVLQVVDELVEQHRLLVQRFDDFGPRFGHAIAHRLEIPAQVRQWRAQLVRDVGDHGPPQLFGARQPIGHRIERVCQLPDLVARLDRHTLAEIAALHAPGRRGQRADRPQDAACESHGQGHRHNSAHQYPHHQGPRDRADKNLLSIVGHARPARQRHDLRPCRPQRPAGADGHRARPQRHVRLRRTARRDAAPEEHHVHVLASNGWRNHRPEPFDLV